MKKKILLLMVGIIIVNCGMDSRIKWDIPKKGEVYQIQLSNDEKRFYAYTSHGLICINILNGDVLWENGNIVLLQKQVELKNTLILGSGNDDGILFISGTDGALVRKIPVAGIVTRTAIDNNLLYFTTEQPRVNKRTLNVIDLKSEKPLARYDLIDYPKGPILITNRSVILATYNDEKNELGRIYCFDKVGLSCKWKIDVYFGGLITDENIASKNGRVYAMKLSDREKNTLMEIDEESGEITRQLKPSARDAFRLSDFVLNTRLLSNNESLFIDGVQNIFIYHYATHSITGVTSAKYDSFSINENSIFCYEKRHGRIVAIGYKGNSLSDSKDIYNLSGRELFKMHANKNYLLLITAENIREAFADKGIFHYTLINL